MTTEAISAAVDLVTTVFGDVVTLIAGNPLLLAYAVVPLIGVGIGIFKRLS